MTKKLLEGNIWKVLRYPPNFNEDMLKKTSFRNVTKLLNNINKMETWKCMIRLFQLYLLDCLSYEAPQFFLKFYPLS